jgi:aspartate racemase
MQTKIIGVIGGTAPASTIDYYISIVSQFQKRTGVKQYPHILINSINMTTMLNFVAEKKFDALVDFLAGEIERLKNGGADFVVLASNTPQIVLEQLKQKSSLPLLSIVESTIAFVKVKKFTRLGLFGTKSTMQGGFYQRVAAKDGIEIFLPEDEEQNYIHEHYMKEFVIGYFRREVKNELINIAFRMKALYNINAIILGGTEIPLILKPEDLPEIELINTTKVHVDAILDYAMK